MTAPQLILNTVDYFLSPMVADFQKKLAKNQAAMRIISLYGDSKFVPIRFWDAPFIQVEKLVTKSGLIVDLGCGEGIFTNFLATSSPQRKIIAVEVDKERFKSAKRDFKNVTFKHVDATKFTIPKCDNVVMFHLLHHLNSYSLQEKVMSRALASLKKGGKLIMVEVDIEFSLKYLLSYFTDCFLVPWIFEHRFYTSVYFRRSSDWKKLIESYGFKCRVRNVSDKKPFSHVLIEGYK